MSCRSTEELNKTNPFMHMHNNQTQHLSGLKASEIFGAQSEEVLDRAYVNIEKHFALVGCSELFDESLLLFRRAIGWKDFPFYTRRNVKTYKSSREPVAEETRPLINEVHKLDCTLYAAMKARFESACRGIDGFEEEVAVFKEQNAEFQKEKKSIGLLSSAHGSWAFLKHLTCHAIRLKRRVL